MEPSSAAVRVEAMDVAVASGIAPQTEVARVQAIGFAHFYEQCRDRVARGLALTLGEVDLAEEAADEAMARAYERWSRVCTFDNAGGWAYRVGLNWARSVLRRRRLRGQELYDPGSTDLPAMADPAVHRALADLDVNHRAVVVCRFFLDWSVEETAAALGVRPGTVKSRLHRATTQLRARLDHLRHEEP